MSGGGSLGCRQLFLALRVKYSGSTFSQFPPTPGGLEYLEGCEGPESFLPCNQPQEGESGGARGSAALPGERGAGGSWDGLEQPRAGLRPATVSKHTAAVPAKGIPRALSRASREKGSGLSLTQEP